MPRITLTDARVRALRPRKTAYDMVAKPPRAARCTGVLQSKSLRAMARSW